MKGHSAFYTNGNPFPTPGSVPQRLPRPAGTPRAMSSSRSIHRLKARSTPAASAWRSRKTARWVGRAGRHGHRLAQEGLLFPGVVGHVPGGREGTGGLACLCPTFIGLREAETARSMPCAPLPAGIESCAHLALVLPRPSLVLPQTPAGERRTRLAPKGSFSRTRITGVRGQATLLALGSFILLG